MVLNIKEFIEKYEGDLPRVQLGGEIFSSFGDKWNLRIMASLAKNPHRVRFTELKRNIGGISKRMLILNLRVLERNGFIKREILTVSPPYVVYELTPMGQALIDQILILGNWVGDHLDEIQQARSNFDAKEENQGGPALWQVNK